eukprot:scaffold21778_cov131-Isochrysis_galbana.AAC.5
MGPWGGGGHPKEQRTNGMLTTHNQSHSHNPHRSNCRTALSRPATDSTQHDRGHDSVYFPSPLPVPSKA